MSLVVSHREWKVPTELLVLKWYILVQIIIVGFEVVYTNNH